MLSKSDVARHMHKCSQNSSSDSIRMVEPAFKALCAAARQVRKRRQRLIRQQRQAVRRVRHAGSLAALRGHHREPSGAGRQLPSCHGMRATVQHLHAKHGSDHMRGVCARQARGLLCS